MAIVLLILSLLVFSAIKWIKKLEDSVRSQHEGAERSRQTLITYVRVLSHEVGNPIFAIQNGVEALRATLNTAPQLRELSLIENSAQVAGDVLQNIVTLNKGRAPEHSESRDANLRDCVESCFRIIRFSNARGIELAYQVDDSVPERIMCDPLRLSQILLNLLGNAVKFTEIGSVELVVRSFEEDEVYWTQFSVTDEGPGIPVDQQQRLFEPYIQGSNEAEHGFKSSGLGLALVKKFVDDMGGRIEIDSRLGVGSAFIVSLPLAPVVESVRTLSPVQPLEREVPQQPRILLAEDNEINQMVAQRMLLKLGCEVVIASNGAIALEIQQQQHFDLILMDLQMPEMDGLTATLAILADSENAPHIVAMTANVLDEERERCIAAGMSDFMSKPIKLDNLRSCLRKHGLL
ncbi:MAG: ATP-binding protein [Pseudomonadales bacterium]